MDETTKAFLVKKLQGGSDINAEDVMKIMLYDKLLESKPKEPDVPVQPAPPEEPKQEEPKKEKK